MHQSRKRRFFALLLQITLALVPCSVAVAADGVFGPGTYTGRATGHGGPVIVTITVDANSIIDISVKADAETPGISMLAVEQTPDRIKAANSAQVDSIAGATFTSKAIITAAGLALDAARAAAP